jgi:hypothetical protein
MLALLGGVALAAYVTDLGEPVDLDLPGRHGRPFLMDDGSRWLGLGRSGSFHVVALDDDGGADLSTFRTIVQGDGEFIDHSFVPCDDGGFLHVASGNRVTTDDTAWVSFVGRDLTWRGTELLVDSDPHYTTNDMPALCAAEVWATGFATEGDLEAGVPGSNELFAFGPGLFGGAGEVRTIPMPSASRMTGTSLVWREDTRQVLAIGLRPPHTLRVVALDEDLVFASRADRVLDLGDLDAYWAQSTAVVEGSMLIAHMVRRGTDGFAQDTGNVALTVVGPELQVLETHVLTDFTAPDGAMRPALVVDGADVIVSFDVGGALHTLQAVVDRDALAGLRVSEDDAAVAAGPAPGGAEGAPPAPPSADPGAPSGEHGAGGCAVAPPVGLLSVLAVPLLLAGRRRSTP